MSTFSCCDYGCFSDWVSFAGPMEFDFGYEAEPIRCYDDAEWCIWLLLLACPVIGRW